MRACPILFVQSCLSPVAVVAVDDGVVDVAAVDAACPCALCCTPVCARHFSTMAARWPTAARCWPSLNSGDSTALLSALMTVTHALVCVCVWEATGSSIVSASDGEGTNSCGGSSRGACRRRGAARTRAHMARPAPRLLCTPRSHGSSCVLRPRSRTSRGSPR